MIQVNKRNISKQPRSKYLSGASSSVIYVGGGGQTVINGDQFGKDSFGNYLIDSGAWVKGNLLVEGAIQSLHLDPRYAKSKHIHQITEVQGLDGRLKVIERNVDQKTHTHDKGTSYDFNGVNANSINTVKLNVDTITFADGWQLGADGYDYGFTFPSINVASGEINTTADYFTLNKGAKIMGDTVILGSLQVQGEVDKNVNDAGNAALVPFVYDVKCLDNSFYQFSDSNVRVPSMKLFRQLTMKCDALEELVFTLSKLLYGESNLPTELAAALNNMPYFRTDEWAEDYR